MKYIYVHVWAIPNKIHPRGWSYYIEEVPEELAESQDRPPSPENWHFVCSQRLRVPEDETQIIQNCLKAFEEEEVAAKADLQRKLEELQNAKSRVCQLTYDGGINA